MTISFKGAHFPQEIILLGVRWYVAYPLSYRHGEELMEELRQIRPQQLAKGCGIIDHLLPLNALLSCVGQLPTFLLDLLQRSRKFLSPRLELM